ncbi:MAG: methionyl-tRNA formyltransferase [Christensenellaceae bacterium]
MTKKSFKIVFMGTPDFAVPSLRMLIENGYDVAAAITQPDRKAGRGHKLMPPPVKVLAEEAGVPVYQFEKVCTSDGLALVKDMAPDLIVTAAFGQILTQEMLDIPKLGCINVHASLLPKLRGAAPIQWAIITGEEKTGITTMCMALALDAGDILEQDEIAITDTTTAGQLYDTLSALGGKTLLRTLEKLAAGTLLRTPQNEEEATYFPMFKKGFGQVDFDKTTREIDLFVRGTNPAPGAYVLYNGEKIKLFAVEKMNTAEYGAVKNGTVVFADEKNGLGIKAADGVLVVKEMQRQGAKRMSAQDSLRGKKIECGYVFMSGEKA